MFAKTVILLATALTTCAPTPDAAQDAVPPQALAGAAPFSQWQKTCEGAEVSQAGWLKPAPPFRVHGNTWYVGTCGITALLVTTPQGNVLVDSGMPEAVPLVTANIERLGYSLTSIKALLTSHEHYDHVGASADLARLTGAEVVALDTAAPQLQSGQPAASDPQRGLVPPFVGLKVSRTLRDGGTFALGRQMFTAYSTPAHTPGSTSWTWRACENAQCRTITYLDSMSTPAAEGYRFSAHADHVVQVRQGFTQAARVPCDILMTPHPGVSEMRQRFASGTPAVDPTACRTYVDGAAARFEALLAREAAAQ